MNQANENDATETTMTPELELELLKDRARKIGIKFSENIGVATLKERIANKIGAAEDPDLSGETFTTAETPLPQPAASLDPVQTPQGVSGPVGPVTPPAASIAQPVTRAPTLREKLIKENMKLVRLRIVNLDPKKKDLPGEIFTVANEYIGTIRKYVPFGEVTEGGYHVPHCIYKMLKSRKFLSIRTRRDPRRNGEEIIEQNWVPEFALEVLPQLTPAELKDLATAQAAAGGV